MTGGSGGVTKTLQLNDSQSIMTYFKGRGIALYCDCQLLRRAEDHFKAHLRKFPVIFLINLIFSLQICSL
jgi:hypothetical protein